LIFEHLTDGVRKRDHDSQWETLWHGNNNNGNTDNVVTKEILDVSKNISTAVEFSLDIGFKRVTSCTFAGELTTP